MLTGKDLIRDVNETQLPDGAFAFWWLGQHSFIVKLGNSVIYLDPFLTDLPGRNLPPLLKPEEVTNATLIFGSHDHLDHIDRAVWPPLAKASPNAKFIVPDVLRERLAVELPLPIDRMIGLDDDRSTILHGIKINALASAHEFFDRDPTTGRYPYLGFVLEGHGCTLYHPGDTLVYEGLLTKLRRWKYDVMFLPINGRDAKRFKIGIIGNMTYQEAADLAGSLQPDMVVPTHYDMFDLNRADPEAFVDYVDVKFPKQKKMIMKPGVKYVLPG